MNGVVAAVSSHFDSNTMGNPLFSATSPVPPSASSTTEGSRDKKALKATCQASKPKPSLLAVFKTIQLAIVLLSLLAIGVMVGVFMPQEGLVELSQIKAQFGQWYRPLRAMGLFSVYSSPWFIALEVLFFFNLLFGSFMWLRPAWFAATRVVYSGPEHITADKHHFVMESPLPASEAQAIAVNTLKKHGFWTHIETPDLKVSSNNPIKTALRAYGHQWSISRLGPVVAHVGILLLLIGSLMGAFTGFKAQQLMVPGDPVQSKASFNGLDTFTPNVNASVWLGSRPDWQLKLHRFDIEFYKTDPTTPKQYESDLEILSADGKQSLARQVVSVNHPLSYDGVMLYQASFAPTGKLFISVNGKPVVAQVNSQFNNRPIAMVPLGNINNNRSLFVFPFFVQKDPGVTKNSLRVFVHDGKGFVGAKKGKMPPNIMVGQGEFGNINGITVGYQKPELATGFQIKKAPETGLVYLAFLIISVGTALCFFAQRRLWVAIEPLSEAPHDPLYDPLLKTGACLSLSYTTNKAWIGCHQDMQRLKTELEKNLSTEKKIS
ncbi:MAG: cytochrome c biogenesis protein ResB [Vampirovibrionales bacterium]|nr:cytochrome c biogenesis protein ResB [Vampirovibrionales bacterium]